MAPQPWTRGVTWRRNPGRVESRGAAGLDTWSHVAPQPWTRGVTWRRRPGHVESRGAAALDTWSHVAPHVSAGAHLSPDTCRPASSPPSLPAHAAAVSTEAHLLRPPSTARSAPPLPSPCVSGAPADRSSPPRSPLPANPPVVPSGPRRQPRPAPRSPALMENSRPGDLACLSPRPAKTG